MCAYTKEGAAGACNERWAEYYDVKKAIGGIVVERGDDGAYTSRG